MREIGSDDRVPSDRAEAGDVGAPVDLAAARTDDAARSEKLVSLGGTSLELVEAESEVRLTEAVHPDRPGL
ncbi:MAG: hypothetical protein ACRDM8_05550, partial [Gaiellaceae bacterium]